MDCIPPGSSVHGISQATILEWVAISYSRGSFWARDQTPISWVSCIGRQVLYHCATWEVQFPRSMFSFTSKPGFIRSFPESHFRRAWGSRYLQEWTGRRRRARSRDRPLRQPAYNQTLPALLSIPGFHRVPRITGSHHNTSEGNLLKKIEGQDL